MKIGLVQIGHNCGDNKNEQHLLPYGAGLLQSYALRHARRPEDFDFLVPIHYAIPVREGVERLRNADLVGFSAYLWNIHHSLKIAEALKRENPEVVILFGGPQVPARAEKFLRENPFIDVACIGEGEGAFVGILENAGGRSWKGVPSAAYIDAQGAFVQNPKAARITDLSAIPSPYLEGAFAPLMRSRPEQNWWTLLETNRGCPFSCTFCDWGNAVASKVLPRDLETVYREIEWIAQQKIGYVGCTDGNFGILPRDLDIARFLVETKKRYGYPQRICIQNAKNVPERSYQIHKILYDADMHMPFVVSMQSLDPATLANVKRSNIKLEAFRKLQQTLGAQGIPTLTDLILGLPGETYGSFAKGVSDLIEGGQHNFILFNNLKILPNSEIGDPEYQKRFGIVTVLAKLPRHEKAWDASKFDLEELVIATDSMPPEDWRRTRAFSWMTDFLYFDKMLQIPLLLAHELHSIGYRELLELFSETQRARFPVLDEIKSFFLERAEEIQNGGFSFYHSDEWLNRAWTADEYMIISLQASGKIDAFYREAEAALAGFLARKGAAASDEVLRDAFLLNRSLLRLPEQREDLEVHLRSDVWEFHQAILSGRKAELRKESCSYLIERSKQVLNSRDAWLQKLRSNGYDRGSIFHKADSVRALAGR